MVRHVGQSRADEYEVDAGPLEWLIDLLHDAGGVRREASMNGVELLPLTWQDLHYWRKGTGIKIKPFWRRELIRLSGVYAQQIRASHELDCEVPFQPE